MCGIAGKVYRDRDRPGDAAALGTMCLAIAHRGPDDTGTWVNGPSAIGMRRLSIIDLSGGHQPIFNETGTIGIVMNGEIYNYRELRSGLLARGHVLRTHSDTEVVVHLYEELGERCVEVLRGMFALAIWDADRQQMLLARDRFGIKPLYIAENRERLAFASELKALVAAQETSRALDHEAIDAYVQLGYMPSPLTPFTDVRKLPPAHTLLWTPEGSTQRQYWAVPTEQREPDGDALETIREALDDSVLSHLEADVPIAAFLSGGIDSSAVVSSMALQGYGVHAFTARYHGSGAAATDEAHLAQALAHKYGARITVVDIEPNIRDLLAPICHALDEPLADESAIPTWLISRAVAGEYKVALAGSGGDELFGGYRRHRAMQMGARYQQLPNILRRTVAGAVGLLRESESGSLTVHRMKRFLRADGATPSDRYAEYMARLTDVEFLRLRGATGDADAYKRLVRSARPGVASSPLRMALETDYRVYLPDDVLAVSDRIASAHSLEVRVPFVDHVLVDRVFPFADHWKIRRSQQKWGLRTAVEARLTPEHMTAPKRGFVGPTASWLRHELRDVLVDELSPERLKRLDLFDTAVVSGWIDEHLSLRHNREGILWSLLSFSVWHRGMVEC